MCSLGSRSEAFKTVVLLSVGRPDPRSFQPLFPHLYLWLCFHWTWRKQCWLQVITNSFMQLTRSETRGAPRRRTEVMESLSHGESLRVSVWEIGIQRVTCHSSQLPGWTKSCNYCRTHASLTAHCSQSTSLSDGLFKRKRRILHRQPLLAPGAFQPSWLCVTHDRPSQRSLTASVLDGLRRFSSTALSPLSHKWPGVGVSGHWSHGIFPVREQFYSDTHTHPRTHPSTHTSVFCHGLVQHTQHHSVQLSHGQGSSYWENAAHSVTICHATCGHLSRRNKMFTNHFHPSKRTRYVLLHLPLSRSHP